MAKALIPLAEGFEDIEAMTVIDVLRRGGVEVITASIGSNLSVKSSHGVEVKADASFVDASQDDYEVIVIPGGSGVERLRESDALISRVIRQRAEGRLLAAICAGPLVLVDAEVFDESQHATCYPTCQLDLPCQWVNEPVVEHEGIITGQGPGSSMLFALVILQAVMGEEMAHKVARGLITEF